MSEDFSVRLCTLVGKHPAIYDMFDANFREESVKKEAWMAISKELGVPDSKCVIKWKGIKHRYVSCRRDEDTSWELLPYLGFLDEVGIKSKVQKRKRESILPASGKAEGSATMTSDQELQARCISLLICSRFCLQPLPQAFRAEEKAPGFVGETKGANKPEDLPIVDPDDTLV
uniref:Putative alcohol dehydrogenase transcription factor myb/sant-like protein n=1 Tax=Ixodes ricinus TaxID=34613 RepID=A0A0K8R9W4_IXORI